MKKKHKFSDDVELSTDDSSIEALSEEERDMLRAEVSNADIDRSQLPPHDNSDRAHLFRFFKKNKGFSFAILLVAVLLVVSFVVLAAVIDKINSDKPCTDDFEVTLGEEIYKLKYKDSMVDGKLYIDIRPIAKYAELTVSGSSKKIKFSGENGTYIQFEDGYDFAKVNGDYVELGGISTVTDDTCIIPFDFFSRSLTSGLLVKLDNETNKIKILRKFYDKAMTIHSDVIFSSGAFQLIENNPDLPNYDNMNDTNNNKIKYPIDITPYIDYICSENLLLCNKTTATLGEDFVPDDLVNLTFYSIPLATDKTFQLQKEAAMALEAMMKAMRLEVSATKNTYVTSAYRSYSYQETTFEYYVKKHMSQDGMTRTEAEAKASTYSARPGQSEHQTGLCVDFMTTEMSALDESFENTAAFDWLSRNAHLYGFILRYPENKTDITGYKYEAWHYRFVGREAAMEMYENNLCLEEYLK